MLRMSLAVASVAAMGLTTSADAYIVGNGMSLNVTSMNTISLNGQPLAGQTTDGALAGARDAGPRAAAAETSSLAVEAVILPNGETVDLR